MIRTARGGRKRSGRGWEKSRVEGGGIFFQGVRYFQESRKSAHVEKK
jgi:hypothetical protein